MKSIRSDEFQSWKVSNTALWKGQTGYSVFSWRLSSSCCILTDPGCERDIGVIISDMKPSKQCITSAKKANQTLGRMARAFSYRDKKVWLKPYYLCQAST